MTYEIEFNSEFWWSVEEIIFVEMLGFKSDIYKRTKFLLRIFVFIFES